MGDGVSSSDEDECQVRVEVLDRGQRSSRGRGSGQLQVVVEEMAPPILECIEDRAKSCLPKIL